MTKVRIGRALAWLTLPALLAGCGGNGDGGADTDVAAGDTAAAAPQDEFWDRLSQPCGQAFGGRLVTAPEGDTMLLGDEALVAHFVACTDSEIRIAFHIGRVDGTWDRSRTWIYTRDAEGLELRHDHREADGSESADTGYGARTLDEGTAERQQFILQERRAPDGSPLGWRVELVPGDRYTYGTIRGDRFTWQVEFDLGTPVAAPPAAWGH